jgi:hypothetical protein
VRLGAESNVSADSRTVHAFERGAVFRRVIEEELVDPNKMVQIGLRATGHSANDFDWARGRDARVVQAERVWYKSPAPLMAEARDLIGTSAPASSRSTSIRNVVPLAWMQAALRPPVSLLADQAFLLKRLRNIGGEFANHLVDVTRIGGAALRTPHELVLSERIDERFDRDDGVGANVDG